MKKTVLAALAAFAIIVGASCHKESQQAAAPAGNATMVTSAPFTVSNWTYDAPSNSWYAMFTDGDITQSVQDEGSLEIFKQYSNGWTNLPDINGKVSTVYNFFKGSFTIIVETTDGSVPSNPGTQTFRTVIVSKQLREAHPNTDWTNYDQTMQAVSASSQAL